MDVERAVVFKEIEGHLVDLGRGNHADNLKLQRFPAFWRVQLSKDEFLGLTFLHNPAVVSSSDRRLGTVAACAVKARQAGAGSVNAAWNLDEVVERWKNANLTPSTVRPLLLRDAMASEGGDGAWYLQDGSHRALAIAMAMCEGGLRYEPVRAYVATSRILSRAS